MRKLRLLRLQIAPRSLLVAFLAVLAIALLAYPALGKQGRIPAPPTEENQFSVVGEVFLNNQVTDKEMSDPPTINPTPLRVFLEVHTIDNLGVPAECKDWESNPYRCLILECSADLRDECWNSGAGLEGCWFIYGRLRNAEDGPDPENARGLFVIEIMFGWDGCVDPDP